MPNRQGPPGWGEPEAASRLRCQAKKTVQLKKSNQLFVTLREHLVMILNGVLWYIDLVKRREAQRYQARRLLGALPLDFPGQPGYTLPKARASVVP
jgi:hypothetical protein